MNLWKLYDDRPDLNIYDVSDILKVGEPLIPKNHVKRLENLDVYKLLYDGNRESLENYYRDELIRYGVYKADSDNKMMVITNYCRQATRDLIWLAISSNPLISSDKKTENKKIQKWMNEKNVNKKLIEKILINCHVTGNCFVRIVPSKGTYNDFQVLDSEQVFPIIDLMTNTVKSYVMIYRYTRGNEKRARYLISEWGKDTVYDVALNGDTIANIQLVGSNATGINGYSIVNFVVNEGLAYSEYGVSAYNDATSLQSSIVRALNTIIVIQERYSHPILQGPREIVENVANGCIGIDDENSCSVNQNNIRDEIEIMGKLVEIDGDRGFEYVQFKGYTEIYQKFIDECLEPKIVKALGNMETLVNRRENVNVDSSKALRLLYSNAINLAEGYCDGIKGKLGELVRILTKLNENSNVNVIFYPGVADFPEEREEYANRRVINGTFSQVDSIMYQDGVSEEEAIAKLKKINEDKKKYEETTTDIKTENITNITENIEQ